MTNIRFGVFWGARLLDFVPVASVESSWEVAPCEIVHGNLISWWLRYELALSEHINIGDDITGKSVTIGQRLSKGHQIINQLF